MKTDLSESHNTCWRLVLTTHTILIELIEQELRQAGLPPLTWYDVLLALEEAPDQRLRLHELADAIILQRSNLTRLIDRLEAARLVSRESCSTDRRGAFATITQKGLATRQQMWPIYSNAIAKYFACHLNDTEVSLLTESLKRMLSHARKV